MNLPAPSVVVATHDLARFDQLLATLASVRAQTLAPEHVVVAVDHNNELADRLRAADPDLVVALNEGGDRGASATRNTGAAAVPSAVVAFLDDDEIAEPQWLERLVAPLADGRVVGTGGRYVPDWERTRPVWFPDEFGWVVGAHHTGMPTTVAAVRNVWSGNMAVRRDVFDKVGGFRVGFGKVGGRSRPEDTDLCMRMAAATDGGHWLYVPTARIHHAVPSDRSTFSFFVRRCYAEGRGKVELQADHGTSDALDVERDYLRRTIPAGLRDNGAEAARACARAAAIAVGLGAAGVGAFAERMKRKS